MVAREEWLGCRHAVAHVGHTRVNTSVGSTYLSLDFSFYKTYMYYVFKTKYIYGMKQKHWWSSDLVLTRRGSENIFRPPIGFKYILNTTDDFQVL